MAAGPPRPTGSLDEVRDKLRERGYLGGPIERFVLRGSGRRTAVLGAAARGAGIGAPVLGALLAGAADPAGMRVSGPDLLLLWLYLTVVSACSIVLLTLGAASLFAALARWRGARPGDALAAGLLIGLPALVYAALLWLSRPQGGGALLDLAFFAVAVGAALLVAWLAGLVWLAGIVGRTGRVPDRRRHPLVRLLAILVPVAGGLLLVPVMRSPAPEINGPPDFAVRGDAVRLMVVGVDGLDRALLDAFARLEPVQNLRKQLEPLARHPFRRRPEAQPPEVWTTLLTGVPVERHGVASADSETLPGVDAPLPRPSGPLPLRAALRFLLPTRRIPTPASARDARSLWEIVALRHRSVAVSWWASWPAGEDPDATGAMGVTDRVLPKLVAGAEADRDTRPASLFTRFAGDFEADRRDLRSRFAAFRTGNPSPEIDAWAWESFLIDAWTWEVAGRLVADPEVQAAFVYLPGLDILRARLASRQAPGLTEQVAGQSALANHLAWLVEALSPILGRADWATLLVADPGRTGETGGEGFLALSGPRARRGCRGRGLDSVDLAPLVLELLGFPQSRELPGSVPGDCLAPAGDAGSVAGYGRPARSDVAPSSYDESMLERLRSLGYVE